MTEAAYKDARAGTKRAAAIAVMRAHADKPMADVLPLIQTALGGSKGEARSFYVWLVENGRAPGTVVKTERVKKVAEVPAGEKAPGEGGTGDGGSVTSQIDQAAIDAAQATAAQVATEALAEAGKIEDSIKGKGGKQKAA